MGTKFQWTIRGFVWLVILFAVSSCSKPEAPRAIELWDVEVGNPRFEKVQSSIESFGTLSWDKKFEIFSNQEGTIERLLVREGDSVRLGALVAIMSNQNIQFAVARAKNAVSAAQSSLDLAKTRVFEGLLQAESRYLGLEKARQELGQSRREYAELARKHQDQETLYQAGGMSEEAIRSARFTLRGAEERLDILAMNIAIQEIGLRPRDLSQAGLPVPSNPELLKEALFDLSVMSLRAEEASAQARLDAARQELLQAELALGELRVFAPAAGVVGARQKEEGERVKREDPLFTIINAQDLVAMVPIRERDAVKLSRGMNANLVVDSVQLSTTGVIELVSPMADAGTGSFVTRIALKDPEGKARPGMFVRTSINLPDERTIQLIPSRAFLVQDQVQGQVFVVSGGSLVRKNLVLGEVRGQDREVLEGLDAETVVVFTPEPAMKEGDRVRAL